MKLIHLMKILLCNTTNPTMNVTEFFQPHHSKVTFPFLQSPVSPSFFSSPDLPDHVKALLSKYQQNLVLSQ